MNKKITYILLATFIILLTEIGFSADQWKEVQLKDCKFSVSFPSTPTIESLSAPSPLGTYYWERAQLKHEEGLYRHECLCPKDGLGVEPTEQYVKERLSLGAAAYGLSNIYFTDITFDKGTAVELRGWKMIRDKPVTYVLRAYATRDCYADVVTASKSSDYPTKGMTRFNKSIKYIPK